MGVVGGNTDITGFLDSALRVEEMSLGISPSRSTLGINSEASAGGGGLSGTNFTNVFSTSEVPTDGSDLDGATNKELIVN